PAQVGEGGPADRHHPGRGGEGAGGPYVGTRVGKKPVAGHRGRGREGTGARDNNPTGGRVEGRRADPRRRLEAHALGPLVGLAPCPLPPCLGPSPRPPPAARRRTPGGAGRGERGPAGGGGRPPPATPPPSAPRTDRPTSDALSCSSVHPTL